MKGLIGRKLGMTQVFGANGEAVPVTVLEVATSTVLQVKTTERDGYEAIQVGYGRKKLHRATKANRVRAEAAGLDTAPVRIREFRTSDASRFKVGDEIAVDFFRAGDRVKVRGTSKGRGFAGVIKRHGFSGGTRTSHGGGPSHRGVGSVGMSADPARTNKGRKLPGQHGNRQVTANNLMVINVDSDEELLLVKGSVPGPMYGLVTIELMGKVPRLYTPPEEVVDEASEETIEEAAEEMMEEALEGAIEEAPEETPEEVPAETPEEEVTEKAPEEEVTEKAPEEEVTEKAPEEEEEVAEETPEEAPEEAAEDKNE